jgi:hypothetical protein
MCAGTIWQQLKSMDNSKDPGPADNDAQFDSLWNIVEVALTCLFALEVVRRLN